MKDISLVIARYSEDISWINKFNIKKFIYNKGEDEIPDSVKLPNIGLEPHTFIYHIINNYNNFELFGPYITEPSNYYSWLIPSHVSCFGYPLEHSFFYFRAGGQFVVSKQKILSNPIEFYQHLYSRFYLDPSDPLYVVHGDKWVVGLPHFFERFWSKIFGENNGF